MHASPRQWSVSHSIASGLLALASAVGAVRGDEDPVAAGADALRSGSQPPWYDRGADSVAPPRSAPSPSDPFRHRNSDWLRLPKNAQGNSWNFNWGLGGLWEVLQWGVWLLMILLLGLLVTLLLFYFVRRTRVLDDGESSATAPEWFDEARLSELPVEVEKGDLLAQAKAAMHRGDFRRAIICLYGYQLLRLDGGNIIRLAKGKTNRQYLREARRVPELKSILARTMVAFEEAYFGGRLLESGQFQKRWNELDRFHQGLEEIT